MFVFLPMLEEPIDKLPTIVVLLIVISAVAQDRLAVTLPFTRIFGTPLVGRLSRSPKNRLFRGGALRGAGEQVKPGARIYAGLLD
jgi:hypothetical protein